MRLAYRDTYKLNNFLIRDRDFMYGREIVNKFDYMKLYNHYCDILGEKSFDGLRYDNNSEYYQRTINLANSNFYNIEWSITRLKEIIKSSNLSECMIDVKNFYGTVDLINISNDRLITAEKNMEPIIIGAIPFLNPTMFVLDGNHRLVSRYKKGIKYINGYLLTPGHFITAINSEYIKTVFMIHYNLWLIDYYMTGRCDLRDFNKNLFRL